MFRGTLVCLGLLVASTTAQAANLRVGGDVAVVIPTGSWGDVSSIGIGGMAKGEFLALPTLALTGRLGYIYHLSKEDVLGVELATAELPLLFGAKFYVMGEPEGLYGAAEVGFVSYRAYFGGISVGSKSYFAATAGVGYDIGGFDLRGQVFLPSVGAEGGFNVGIMVTAGYAVTLF